MSKQYNKVEKRTRRKAYLIRRKARVKTEGAVRRPARKSLPMPPPSPVAPAPAAPAPIESNPA